MIFNLALFHAESANKCTVNDFIHSLIKTVLCCKILGLLESLQNVDAHLMLAYQNLSLHVLVEPPVPAKMSISSPASWRVPTGGPNCLQ